ncbi:MAG: RluA family pseudouridine synthase [Bacteroidetes bacterium]|nr:RluA family pseudouridine synthase [Bacteroidota bacterium]MCH8524618.1 RluA family pseudouridine synthase [Balneolales bacterium]
MMLPDWLHIPAEAYTQADLHRHLRFPHQSESGLCCPVRIVAPYDYTHTFRVKPSEADMRLIELLRYRFPFRNQTAWEQKIQDAYVLLNDAAVEPDQILRQNDRISHRNIAVKEPSIPDDIRILYENKHILLVDKPAPVPVHPGGRYNKNTVISVLDAMGYPNLRVVHRLDAVTAGLLLLAKSADAANQLKDIFINGSVYKYYEAIVHGVPDKDEVTIRAAIKRKHGIQFMCSEDADSKPALTHFKVLERGENWTRVGCEPVTGRTHQIRLHLQQWGYPIWDDPLYGPAAERDLTRPDAKSEKWLRDVGLDAGDQLLTEAPDFVDETRPTSLASGGVIPAMQKRAISLVNMQIAFNRLRNSP